jgi:hypothetical protein
MGKLTQDEYGRITRMLMPVADSFEARLRSPWRVVVTLRDRGDGITHAMISAGSKSELFAACNSVRRRFDAGYIDATLDEAAEKLLEDAQ